MVIALHLIALVPPLAAAEAAATLNSNPCTSLNSAQPTQLWLKWAVNSGQENGQSQRILEILKPCDPNSNF